MSTKKATSPNMLRSKLSSFWLQGPLWLALLMLLGGTVSSICFRGADDNSIQWIAAESVLMGVALLLLVSLAASRLIREHSTLKESND